MSSIYSIKIIISSALLILLIVAGVYIHRTGKPYNNFIFSIHKIFTIVMIIILVIVVKSSLRETDVGLLYYLLLIAASVALTGLLISGGMMSLDRHQETMLVIHRICTAIFLICYPVLVWFLFANTLNNI
jgi:hypothetical protein